MTLLYSIQSCFAILFLFVELFQTLLNCSWKVATFWSFSLIFTKKKKKLSVMKIAFPIKSLKQEQPKRSTLSTFREGIIALSSVCFCTDTRFDLWNVSQFLYSHCYFLMSYAISFIKRHEFLC